MGSEAAHEFSDCLAGTRSGGPAARCCWSVAVAVPPPLAPPAAASAENQSIRSSGSWWCTAAAGFAGSMGHHSRVVLAEASRAAEPSTRYPGREEGRAYGGGGH